VTGCGETEQDVATAGTETLEPDGSKAEVAYRRIRNGILDGHYRAGQRLVLERVATEIGTSSVPVREALRRLEAEGYVAFKRNVGATVRTIDAAAYAESMETLAIVEAAATALAAPVLPKKELLKARRINEAMAKSLDLVDPLRFVTLNSEFHETLYRVCPNSYLVGLADRESDRLRGLRQGFAFVPGRSSQAVSEHAHLLDLIEAHATFGTIEDYARAHRSRTVRAFLERYESGL
jgi:DNA-binding GntR family transcriptional regulator